MKDNVRLEKVRDRNAQQILTMINNDATLKETFGGKKDTQTRLLDASYIAVIKDLDETVGFIMLVDRGGKQKIDMGILSQYTHKGYGTRALELLKELIVSNKIDVEIQVKKTNEYAIKTVLKNGFILDREDKEHNYYSIKMEKNSKRI